MYTLIDAFNDILKTRERFSRLPVTFSNKEKERIKNLAMNTHNSFNLENASSQDLHSIIQSGDFPSFLNSFQRDRIKELYSKGKTFDAIRKLQSLIDSQNSKPKTFL